jgi:hypothetical protein
LPDPTLIETNPPEPDLEEPLPSKSDPLLPELDVPVLRINVPLIPDDPALEVRSNKLPLVLTELYPLSIVTRPPVE